MTHEEKLQRYRDALHAVQTGIMWVISFENGEVDVNSDPNLMAHKHLRTGIDATKSDMGGLVSLLIRKGVITDDEYLDAILEYAEREKRNYEELLTEKFGRKIELA